MGALANFIERAGVATASISLIREQSEAVRPPRALWVPFALGRPFGSADNAEFQTAVLRASLGMLGTATQPTIEDYPLEAPAEAQPGQWVCPVNFPIADDPSFTARLEAEVLRLAPWSAETRATRGRTLFGVTGAQPDQVLEVARALGQIADTGNLSDMPQADQEERAREGRQNKGRQNIEWAFPMPLLVRHLADDLRTFYHEAIAAQPGPDAPNHEALNDWIFGGTALGETLQAIGAHLSADGGSYAMLVRGLLIPEGYFKGGSAFPDSAEFGKS